MRVISNFVLQYTNSNFASLSSSPFDLIITEGAPLPRAGSVPQLTDSQVQSLQAQGRTVVGYVNAAVTDTFRSYWNTAWTVNGDDRGALTGSAPAWLQNGVPNAFGRIVDFSDPAWQLIVINQAKDLVSRGYSGVFIDDVAAYFALGDPNGTLAIRARATQMANLVARVAAEIRAINPDAYVVVNSNPFLPGDVTIDAPGQAASQAFLSAVDAHLLENSELSTINQAATSLQGHQLLFLFSNGNPAISLAEASLRGAVYYSPTLNYDSLGSFVGAATSTDNILRGGDGPNILSGLAGNDTLEGAKGNDVLVGGIGNDILSGGTGLNELIGGGGDDVYIIETRTDSTVEFVGEGSDEVRTAFSIYGLQSNIENLTAIDAARHGALVGNALDNVITGNFGNDDLFGRAGNDTLRGGSGAANSLFGQEGDDIYIVEAVGDSIIEFANQGIDSVQTALASLVLRDHVENLTYTGAATFTGIGATGANTLTGGAGADFLSGLGGADILVGRSGADFLLGGAGADQYRYEGGETGFDRITDFVSGVDKIALRDAGFVQTATFALAQGGTPVATTTNSTFLYNVNTGILSFDVDGTGTGAAVTLAQLNGGLTLAAGDFVFY